jgi:hypothetical protein
MKKLISAVAILIILALTACSNQTSAPNDNSNAINLLSEGITMLDDDMWPENEYTDGLPVPNGTVAWAMLDTERGNCSINIVDIAENDYNDYMKLLEQNGFSITEGVAEEVKGQDYVSIGTLLSNGEKGLSIGYIPDNLTIYISLKNKK